MLRREPWIWAVGIEDTFIRQTTRGERPLDEYDLTQHTQFWLEDLERAHSLGVQMIRYGIPWYKVQPSPFKFDWSWTDKVMEYFESHTDLVPIIDLMHYGTPVWMENEFMNNDYPRHVAEYAAEFAKRYQSFVRYFTPLNEPFINAEWCGWSGSWPPYLKGHRGFVAIMNQLCKGIVLTVNALRETIPGSVMIHVEASKKYVATEVGAEEEAILWNEIRNVMWELIQGKVQSDHPLRKWLLERGLNNADFKWFEDNKIDIDIIGLNYYPQFSLNAIRNGQMRSEEIPEPIQGTGQDLLNIVQDTYNRYKRPIFITETSYRGTVEERISWMNELERTCRKIVSLGIDLYGVTWFPFIGMIEWQYRTNGGSIEENIAPFGLYDLVMNSDGQLSRVATEAVTKFRELVQGSPIE